MLDPQPSHPVEHVVYVHADGAWSAAADLTPVHSSQGWTWSRSEGDVVLLPTQTRSEIVVRAGLERDGVRFLLASGDAMEWPDTWLRVRAVEHAADEQVLEVDDDLRIVSAIRLPRAVTSAAGVDVLPHLARQDGAFLAGDTIVLIPPDDSAGWSWFALGPGAVPPSATERMNPSRPEAGRAASGASERSALDLGALAEPVRWEVRGWDQVFGARARAIEPGELRVLACRGMRAVEALPIGWQVRADSNALWPGVAVEETQEPWEPIGGEPSAHVARVASFPARSARELCFGALPVAGEGRAWTILLEIHAASPAPAIEHAVAGLPLARDAGDPRESGRFVDVAREVGVDMVHVEGPDLQLDIRPTMGPGAAWGDVDGDGWVDLFLPQGGGRTGCEPPTSRFYRNVEGRRFVDESARRGLALAGAGMGALFYDADGDGDLDLFVANYGRNRFLLNDGSGVFADASAAVGLDTDRWHAAVSAADYDADGDLDLYLTGYLVYDPAQMPGDEELGRYQREDPVEMLPFAFPGERKSLLRCEAATTREAAVGTPLVGIRYTDVAKELGAEDAAGRGMQAIWWDFDQDGDQDLYLANDVSPNRFWRNEGGGKLKDVSFSTGLDDPRGCMGLVVGDVDGDLDEDLFVTNWQLESNALYVNNLRHTSTKSRVSTFRDRAVEAGLAQLSVGVTGWGCELADFDLDGDLDLLYANGYTSPDYETTGVCVGQPGHYFVNDGAGNFRAAFEEAGRDLAIPLAARALVACDWDQDGDLDAVVTANNGRVRLLRNDGARAGAWLGVRLAGRGANTRAIGARVVVEADGKRHVRTLRAGTGYLSGNAPELHFGLGPARSGSCTVTWPSGRTSTHALDALDRFVTLAEPE